MWRRGNARRAVIPGLVQLGPCPTPHGVCACPLDDPRVERVAEAEDVFPVILGEPQLTVVRSRWRSAGGMHRTPPRGGPQLKEDPLIGRRVLKWWS